MLDKSIYILVSTLLVAAIKFSQISAAPVEDGRIELNQFTTSENDPLDNFETQKPNTVEISQPQVVNDPPSPHVHPRQAELEILKKIPEFVTIAQSLEELPDDVFNDMKHFLRQMVPRMPRNDANVATLHLNNALIMIELFERVVKEAKREEEENQIRKKLFNDVHRVVPQLHFEMNFMNDFIGDVRSRLNEAKSARPAEEMVAEPRVEKSENEEANEEIRNEHAGEERIPAEENRVEAGENRTEEPSYDSEARGDETVGDEDTTEARIVEGEANGDTTEARRDEADARVDGSEEIQDRVEDERQAQETGEDEGEPREGKDEVRSEENRAGTEVGEVGVNEVETARDEEQARGEEENDDSKGDESEGKADESAVVEEGKIRADGVRADQESEPVGEEVEASRDES